MESPPPASAAVRTASRRTLLKRAGTATVAGAASAVFYDTNVTVTEESAARA